MTELYSIKFIAVVTLRDERDPRSTVGFFQINFYRRFSIHNDIQLDKANEKIVLRLICVVLLSQTDLFTRLYYYQINE